MRRLIEAIWRAFCHHDWECIGIVGLDGAERGGVPGDLYMCKHCYQVEYECN